MMFSPHSLTDTTDNDSIKQCGECDIDLCILHTSETLLQGGPAILSWNLAKFGQTQEKVSPDSQC